MKELSLSASILGTNCLRKLWFIANGIEGPEPDEATRRIFDIGRALEPVAIEWEKRKGREVFYNAKSHEDEPDFILKVGKGTIVGRFDAIFDREILVDVKTCSSNKFAKILEDGEVPREWIVQVNVYFFGLKLGCCREDIRELIDSIKKVGIYAVHKESGKTAEIVRDPDLAIFEGVLKKASMVFSMEDPFVLSIDPDECNRCKFKGICKELEKGGVVLERMKSNV
jgi:CRISPR/Cas system-associated exonuclease Cas4 (RecB family)